MATISSTLEFQDRMSAKLESINRKMDMTATELKIAKANVEQLENVQKQWKITLEQLEKTEVKDKNAIAQAREEHLKALRAYDDGVLKVQKYEAQLAQLEQQQKQNTQGFESMAGKIVTLSAAFQLFNQAKAFISGLNSKINEYIQYTQTQMQAEDQLSIITKQRMNLTDDEVRSLYGLAAAQQKVGVVGDEAVIAGMAGVAAFTKQKSSVEALTPAMNNLAVKMYGYNVTAESMTNISKLLGKAMLGDVSALSRMGIKIDDVTKKRLMLLKEEERAIELAKIIKNVTGDMNEEMAKTPFGQIAQANNKLGDSYEKLGAVLLPLQAKMTEIFSNVVEKIVNNLDTIVPLVTVALGIITVGFIALNATAISAAVSSAAAWIAATAPLWIVIGVIALISAGLNALGLSFKEQSENLVISFNWIITTIKNVGIAFQNVWTFITTATKLAIDGWKIMFASYFDFLLRGFEPIAKIIDKIFHTDISSTISKFRTAAQQMEKQSATNAQNNLKNMKFKSFEENDIWTNQAKAQKFMNTVGGGLTKGRALLGTAGAGINALDKFSDGNALKTKQQGDITISDDDIELLNDIATKDFAQYYQSLTPTLNIPSMVIHETADVNEVVSAVTNSITGFARSSTYNTDSHQQAILPA